MTEKRERTWGMWLWVAIASPFIIGAVFLSHAPSIQKGEFILDDENNIVHHEIALRNIDTPEEFLRFYYDRPVTSLTFLAQVRSVQPGQLRKHVTDFRLFNASIHAAVSVLFLIVLTLALRRSELPMAWSLGIGIVASAFFAVHPLSTNVVAYPVQRSESIFALCLLTLLLGLHAATSRPVAGAAIAIPACAIGMLSKAVMVTAPPIALLYDRAVLTKSWKETLRKRWWIHGLITANWILLVWPTRQLRFLATQESGATRSTAVGFGVEGVTSWEYLRTQPEVILHYLHLTFWPDGFALDRGWPVSQDIGVDIVLGLLLGISLLTAAGIAAIGRRATPFAFAVTAVFVILAPTSSFVPLKDLSFEHRFYLPLASVIALTIAPVAVGVRHLGRKWAVTCAAMLAILIGAALGVRTHQESVHWQSKLALAQRDLASGADHLRQRVNLSVALINQGDLTSAEKHLRAAYELDPQHPFVNYNLAVILRRRGDINAAIEHLKVASPRLPGPFGFAELGQLLRQRGDADQAARMFVHLARSHPHKPLVQANLGNALSDLGRYDLAAVAFKKAADQARSFGNIDIVVRAEFNLGNMFYRLERYTEAAEAYGRVLEIRPRHPHALKWREKAMEMAQTGEASTPSTDAGNSYLDEAHSP